MNTVTILGNLVGGQTFEIPSLNGIMRGGVLLNNTQTASLVSIDEKGDKGWVKVRERIASSIPVEITGSVELEKNEQNLLVVKGQTVVDSAGKVKVIKPAGNGKRGRQAIQLDIEYPDKPFTIAQIADKYKDKVSSGFIYLRIKGNSDIVEVNRVKSATGRGKATVWYAYKPKNEKVKAKPEEKSTTKIRKPKLKKCAPKIKASKSKPKMKVKKRAAKFVKVKSKNKGKK